MMTEPISSSERNLFPKSSDVCKEPSFFIPSTPKGFFDAEFETSTEFFKNNTISIYNAAQYGSKIVGIASPDRDSPFGVGDKNMKIFSLENNEVIHPIQFNYYDRELNKNFSVKMNAIFSDGSDAKGIVPSCTKSRTMEGFGLKYIDEYGKINTLDRVFFNENFDKFISKEFTPVTVVTTLLDEFINFCEKNTKETNYNNFLNYMKEELGIYSKKDAYALVLRYAGEMYESNKNYENSFLDELYDLISYANEIQSCPV